MVCVKTADRFPHLLTESGIGADGIFRDRQFQLDRTAHETATTFRRGIPPYMCPELISGKGEHQPSK